MIHRGEVRCWFFAIDSFEASDLAFLLSADERRRRERFAFEKDRSTFTVCRGLLRTLLSRYAGEAPGDLRFEFGANGKPALAGGLRHELNFSLSHSHGFGLIALTGIGPLGVDLESIRPVPGVETLVASQFAREEAQEFMRQPVPARMRSFFAGWTRKEAFVKATGEGLARDWTGFAVALAPEPGAARLLRLDAEPEAVPCWNITDLNLGPDFAAAIALRAHRPIVRVARLRDRRIPHSGHRAPNDGGSVEPHIAVNEILRDFSFREQRSHD